MEVALAAQIARHEEVEERPELENVVLNGSAAEDESVVALQLLDRSRQLRLAVLDDVTFVKDAEVPLDAREEVDVVANDLVRSDEQVVLRRATLQTNALGRCARVQQRVQELPVNETFDFVKPVPGDGRRADDEGGQRCAVGCFRLL